MELLIWAKGHWRDSLTPAEVSALSETERVSYDARTQMGDIISVHPDGSLTQPPCSDYIIVKLPGVAYDPKYEERLFDITVIPGNPDQRPKLLKRRKYRVPQAVIENYVAQGNRYITIDVENLRKAFLDALIAKAS